MTDDMVDVVVRVPRQVAEKVDVGTVPDDPVTVSRADLEAVLDHSDYYAQSADARRSLRAALSEGTSEPAGPCEACDGEGYWFRYEGEGDASQVPCDICNGSGRDQFAAAVRPSGETGT